MAPLKLRQLSGWLCAALAIGYLALMLRAGTLPEYAHFNAFEAMGLMREPPESVTQVDLRSPTDRCVVSLAGGQWVNGGGRALPPAIAAQLTAAVRFMHTAAPVRTLEVEEIGNTLAQFGLAPAALTVTLSNANGTLLQFTLGGDNPDGILRYLQATGQPGILLMSGFIGQAWDSVATALLVAPISQP